TLATARSKDRTVKLWDLTVRKEVMQPTAVLEGHPDDLGEIAFAADGKTRAGVSGNPRERATQPAVGALWDVAPRKQRATLHGHEAWIECLAFAPDSKTLATGGSDQTVRLWEVGEGKLCATLKGYTTMVTGLAFAPTSSAQPPALVSCGFHLRLGG